MSVEAIVKLGHSISDYGELVDKLHIDLLVMHTRDDEQLAMHGLAYPLTIEFRQTPLPSAVAKKKGELRQLTH